jgi:hypothetical protein
MLRRQGPPIRRWQNRHFRACMAQRGGCPAMANFIEPDPELEAALNDLSRGRIQELRERWRATFRTALLCRNLKYV